MERISWTDKITNEEVLRRVGEKRIMLETIVRRKKNWIGHMAEWLRRRGASPGVLGSIPGAGNSLAARYRPLSKAVKCKSNASS